MSVLSGQSEAQSGGIGAVMRMPKMWGDVFGVAIGDGQLLDAQSFVEKTAYYFQQGMALIGLSGNR